MNGISHFYIYEHQGMRDILGATNQKYEQNTFCGVSDVECCSSLSIEQWRRHCLFPNFRIIYFVFVKIIFIFFQNINFDEIFVDMFSAAVTRSTSTVVLDFINYVCLSIYSQQYFILSRDTTFMFASAQTSFLYLLNINKFTIYYSR